MSTATVDAPTRTLTPVRRSWISDVRLVMTRELRPVAREPFSVVFGLIQPLVRPGLHLELQVGPGGGRPEQRGHHQDRRDEPLPHAVTELSLIHI